MNLNEEVEALRRIPFFAAVDPSKIKLLAFASEQQSFPAGAILFSEGDPGDAAYLILDGEAAVMASSPYGPVKVATISRNAFLGEIAVLCNVPRTATVVALAPIKALKIDKDVFLQLMRDVPQIAFEMMRELALRLDDTTDRLRDAQAKIKEAGLL